MKNQIEELTDRVQHLEKAFHQQSDEIEQTLGRVLGFPWYCDDQINFPGATKEDGVCVGDHVPESLAMVAAKRITDLEACLKSLEQLLVIPTTSATVLDSFGDPYDLRRIVRLTLKGEMDWEQKGETK